MNEKQTASAIVDLLNEGAERVSYKVQHRLERARRNAVNAAGRASPAQQRVAVPGEMTVLADGTAGWSSGSREPADSWAMAVARWLIPMTLLIVGLWGIGKVQLDEESDVLATENLLLLVDELPPAAYADHGFGVFMNNTRIAAEELAGANR